MKIGMKWIGVMTVTCLVAIWMVARDEAESIDDQATGEERRASQRASFPERPANVANGNLSLRDSPESGSVHQPDTLRSIENKTQASSEGRHQAAQSDTSHKSKKAIMAASDRINDLSPEETTMAEAAPPPPGIQLAPDVRLPVAALPIDFETNDVTARMLDLIVDDYYRDLADGVTQGEDESQTIQILEENGETTILVGNGPVVEAARKRADWRFRTIFGKEAYNRISIQSNLEARLPASTPVIGSE